MSPNKAIEQVSSIKNEIITYKDYLKPSNKNENHNKYRKNCLNKATTPIYID